MVHYADVYTHRFSLILKFRKTFSKNEVSSASFKWPRYCFVDSSSTELYNSKYFPHLMLLRRVGTILRPLSHLLNFYNILGRSSIF